MIPPRKVWVEIKGLPWILYTEQNMEKILSEWGEVEG